MITVYLGNPAPHRIVSDPVTDEATVEPLDGPQVTVVRIPHDDAFAALLELKDLWKAHGSEPPSWLSSDSDSFADVAASALGTKVKAHSAAATAYAKAQKGATR